MTKEKLKFNPNYAIHPGEHIKEDLEHIAKYPKSFPDFPWNHPMLKIIQKIIKKEADITSEVAEFLEKFLGTPASFWLNLQKNYDKQIKKPKEQK